MTAIIQNLRLALIASLFLAVAACGGSKAQENTDAANNEIDRMNAIQAELRADGVIIGSLVLSRSKIDSMNAAELKATETLLTEYINRGANALDASNKDGVVYSEADRNKMRTLIQSAKTIRNEIQNRLKESPDSTDDTADEVFWKSYHACYDLADSSKWISGGIDTSKWSTSRDGAKFGRLTRTAKAKFRTDVGEFKRCIGVIIKGRTDLGHTTEVRALVPKNTAITAAAAYAKSH